MVPTKKKSRRNSTCVDTECAGQLNLLFVCGFCFKNVGEDELVQVNHVLSHVDEITQCRTCCLPVKINKIEEHKKDLHCFNYRHIKFEIDRSLIEFRIATGKSFSNFWGIRLSSKDPTLNNFSSVSKRWWSNYKNGRSLGCFRVIKSKVHWKCSICRENKQSSVFNETISMRSYALSHLEKMHFDEIMMNDPSFLEFEWFHLQEEVDFDIRALMHIAQQRSQLLHRSFFTFYTIDLSKLENGEHFSNEMKRRNRVDGNMRYCLICCSLVPIHTIRQHFRSQCHSYLEAVPESTAFVHVPQKSESVDCVEEEEANKEIRVQSKSSEQEFEFPRELFLYTNVFITLRRDDFRWRCCLCPHAHALIFATQIVMRMYALRHIEDTHKFLFTEEFLSFEWMSIQHEIRASFDIRHFSPLDYTTKGEETFNNRDPNDYMLPQQYYFLTKEHVSDTVICGFCYCSFNRVNFLLHIAIHGFVVSESESCVLRPIVLNNTVRELMGQSNYLESSLDDEPLQILSIEGKRLKTKMDLMNQRNVPNSLRFSELTTPKSECNTDCESYTPRGRKSAVDARKLLTETFKILQENARNRRNTWNQSSCSDSSSDESNSEDERFEKQLYLESTTVSERIERAKSKETEKVDISKMRPSELRKWIRKEAVKNSVSYPSSDNSSPESNADSDSEQTDTTGSKWSSMKPKDIKKLIRKAAKRKQIELHDGSTSCSENDE